MSRVFLVHGWGGSPQIDWFPWAKKELEEKGYEVFSPEMPDADYPKIEPWVRKLKETVGEVRRDDIFIGHSIGCQAVERYLQTLSPGTKFDKVILIAPWVVLTRKTFEEMGENEEVVKAWYEEPIEYEKIKGMAEWTAVFSDDDPFVNYKDNYPIYKNKLGAKVILKKKKGHFAGEQGVNKIPFLLKLLD
jgi:predicted alpha/beta hydrolase family esterase